MPAVWAVPRGMERGVEREDASPVSHAFLPAATRALRDVCLRTITCADVLTVTGFISIDVDGQRQQQFLINEVFRPAGRDDDKSNSFCLKVFNKEKPKLYLKHPFKNETKKNNVKVPVSDINAPDTTSELRSPPKSRSSPIIKTPSIERLREFSEKPEQTKENNASKDEGISSALTTSRPFLRHSSRKQKANRTFTIDDEDDDEEKHVENGPVKKSSSVSQENHRFDKVSIKNSHRKAFTYDSSKRNYRPYRRSNQKTIITNTNRYFNERTPNQYPSFNVSYDTIHNKQRSNSNVLKKSPSATDVDTFNEFEYPKNAINEFDVSNIPISPIVTISETNPPPGFLQISNESPHSYPVDLSTQREKSHQQVGRDSNPDYPNSEPILYPRQSNRSRDITETSCSLNESLRVQQNIALHAKFVVDEIVNWNRQHVEHQEIQNTQNKHLDRQQQTIYDQHQEHQCTQHQRQHKNHKMHQNKQNQHQLQYKHHQQQFTKQQQQQQRKQYPQKRIRQLQNHNHLQVQQKEKQNLQIQQKQNQKQPQLQPKLPQQQQHCVLPETTNDQNMDPYVSESKPSDLSELLHDAFEVLSQSQLELSSAGLSGREQQDWATGGSGTTSTHSMTVSHSSSGTKHLHRNEAAPMAPTPNSSYVQEDSLHCDNGFNRHKTVDCLCAHEQKEQIHMINLIHMNNSGDKDQQEFNSSSTIRAQQKTEELKHDHCYSGPPCETSSYTKNVTDNTSRGQCRSTIGMSLSHYMDCYGQTEPNKASCVTHESDQTVPPLDPLPIHSCHAVCVEHMDATVGADTDPSKKKSKKFKWSKIFRKENSNKSKESIPLKSPLTEESCVSIGGWSGHRLYTSPTHPMKQA